MKKNALILFLAAITLSTSLYGALERLGNWLSGGPRYKDYYYYDNYGTRYYTTRPRVYYTTDVITPSYSYYTGRAVATNKTSIVDNNNNYVITLVMPGFNENDIHVSAGQNTVQIEASGQKIENSALANPPINSYSQTIPLNLAIKPLEVQSNYNNGVLTITAPKATSATPVRVPVRVK